MKCAVLHCKNKNHSRGSSSDMGFFRFPKDPIQLKKWAAFCHRRDVIPKSSRICMEHFTSDSFQNGLQYEMGYTSRIFLKPGAVPTVYKKSDKPNEQSSEERKKLVDELLQQAAESDNNASTIKLVEDEDQDYLLRNRRKKKQSLKNNKEQSDVGAAAPYRPVKIFIDESKGLESPEPFPISIQEDDDDGVIVEDDDEHYYKIEVTEEDEVELADSPPAKKVKLKTSTAVERIEHNSTTQQQQQNEESEQKPHLCHCDDFNHALVNEIIEMRRQLNQQSDEIRDINGQMHKSVKQMKYELLRYKQEHDQKPEIVKLKQQLARQDEVILRIRLELERNKKQNGIADED